MNKVLIFVTRQMCYDSAGFFAKKLALNLETLGIESEMCMFAEDDIPGRTRLFAAEVSESDGLSVLPKAESMLEEYVGKSYLAVIDFNSKLPRIALEDGTLFLDSMDAPFINYVLDHPLYHHSMLSSPLRNYHVFTVDENHAEYVRKFYPHIRTVHALPLGASEVRNAPRWEDSEKCILFLGTYRDPEEIYEHVKSLKNEPELPAREDILALIERMEGDWSVTIEQALAEVFENRHGRKPEEHPGLFARWMNHSYLAELYLRNRARKEAVEALVQAKLPVRIIGDWWEKLPLLQEAQVQREESVEFAKSYRKIAECQVLLNSSPFFYGGMHDRVPAAMANHTIVLTDGNPYLRRTFGEPPCAHLYEMNDFPRSLIEHAGEALYNESRSREMEVCAFELFKMRYTWLHIAEKVIEYIKEMYE
jgi:glycosyltransferase involved in cell wall biosynthesis